MSINNKVTGEEYEKLQNYCYKKVKEERCQESVSTAPLFLWSKQVLMLLFQNIMDNSVHIVSFLCTKNFVSLQRNSANNNLLILHIAEK